MNQMTLPLLAEASAPIARISLMIVEDHRVLSDLLYRLCVRQWGLDVTAVAMTGQLARECLSRGQPEIALIDLGLPDMAGIDLIGEINQRFPAIKIIVVSSLCKQRQVSQLRSLTIQGFVDKVADGLHGLRTAIERVSRGGTYFSAHYFSIMRQNQSPNAFFKMLSDREQEILRLIGQAFTDAEISAQLEIAESTAQASRRDIMRKLEIHSTPKLIRFCLQKGISAAEFETEVSPKTLI